MSVATHFLSSNPLAIWFASGAIALCALLGYQPAMSFKKGLG
jgi:hypothetical protein